jgi:hypothetical protein
MQETQYYIVLFVHLISLIIGFGAVFVIDIFGLLWLLKWWGVDLNLVRRVAGITQRLIWIGFIGLVASGIPLLIMKGTMSDLTKLKLFLVVLVGLNGIFLHSIKKGLDSLGENIIVVPSRYYFRIGLASAISQLGWWGASAIGFYNRQVGQPVSWSEYYIPIMGIVVFAIGMTWTIGELITSKRL